MRLERLEVENFASYQGSHYLHLDVTPEKPVVIILGGTGAGKSSLFDALNWALYGTDYEQDIRTKRQREIQDYINEKALAEAHESGSSALMSSVLYFEHDGVHYCVNQEIECTAVADDYGKIKPRILDKAASLCEISSSGDYKQITYGSVFLDEILPNNVKDYFFFDGDRIYNLSNPGASQEVRDAIYRVVDLEIVQRGVEHLNAVAREYRLKAKSESKGELSDVEAQHLAAQEERQDIRSKLDTLANEELALKQQISVLEDQLANLPDSSGLQATRQARAEELTRTERRIDDLAVEVREGCARALTALAEPKIDLLIQELESRRRLGLIPKNVSESLLKDLLKIGECLCGTRLEPGSSALQKLTERLELEKTRSSGQEYIDLLIEVRGSLTRAQDARAQLSDRVREREALRELRRELDLQIKNIDMELEKLPKGDAQSAVAALKGLRDNLLSTGRKIAGLKEKESQAQLKIEKLEREREQLSRNQQKVYLLQKRERIAQRAADELDKLYGAFAEDSRLGVENLTREEFRKFARSASGYEVSLSPEYELQVLDSNGNKALQRLSMGQRQCLSLSFILAIARVSEKNPPIVIDMPFGRLDPEVHEEISKRLPALASQVLLFLIPQIEWNDITKTHLGPRVSKLYRLDFDPVNRQSRIIEVS